MKKQAMIGLAAAFGGIFPNLFRLATSMTQGQALPEVSYLLGVALFGFIGAGTAIALGEVEGRKAFFLGLGLPAMMQSATQDLTAAPMSAGVFFPSAYAAELEEDPGRPLELYFATLPPDGLEAAYRVKGSKLVALEPVGPLEDGRYTLAVPASADAFRLQVGGSSSDWLELEPGGELAPLEVTITRKRWSGVKEAIGVRGAALYTIKLEEVKRGNR